MRYVGQFSRNANGNVIRDEFMRHEELFSSDSLNPVERDYLSRMQSDELGEV